RVPIELKTLGAVRHNITLFNPFKNLEFIPITTVEESLNKLTGDAFLKAHGIARLSERIGWNASNAIMGKKMCRNTRRQIEQIRRSMSNAIPTIPELQTIFKCAVSKQMAG